MIKKTFFNFLAKLEMNNHKDWFDMHRDEYEREVKRPFEEFAEALGSEISKFDAEIQGDYRKGIFRINKDIRFAKDKSPYKTNRAVAFSKNGKKDHNDPGYYVELGIHKCYLAGGAWCPSPEKTQQIRSEIYHHLDEFNSLNNQKDFQSSFGAIQGDRAKRLPKEISSWAEVSEYISNKQFYFYKEFPLDDCFNPGLVRNIVGDLRHGYPVNIFLRRAMRR